MTGVLLNLTELAALADVPVDRLRESGNAGVG
jgi:hypothetical protein